MKIISWNVNGIRAILGKGFLDFVDAEAPDVLCIQETKAHQSQVDEILKEYPHHYWNSAEKKGYSGTAIFSRKKPIGVAHGIGIAGHDQEGRVITLEFPQYYLVTVYTPNSRRDLVRLSYRMQWDRDFLAYLKYLEAKKPVIFGGDLNVAHKEIDLANPASNRRNAGFTDEERGGFDNIVSAGFVDSYRAFDESPDKYTWWSYMAGARQRNIGWRIDYFCVSESFLPSIKSVAILPHIMGSDHCPVGIEVKGR
ncbi:MAG: exodeoxyribonuclease III [bacterium]|nr:exodeoxyribonuclease III [bacterium]